MINIQALSTWLRLARREEVVVGSLKVAAVVGTILVTINYGDKLIALSLQSKDFAKMALTYCVPYCVSTYASVNTMMRSNSGDNHGGE